MARPAPMPRLGQGFGLLVDQSRPVEFTFEGRSYRGFEGDVIASALAGSGQWLLSRSFKYHRPRGVLSMAGHDANTLVQLPDEPNVLADRHPLEPGLEVSGQNYRGSLAHDRGASLRLFGRFLPVGFYYRTFHRPKGAWKRWEPIIRSFAGLGKVNLSAPRRYYDKAYGFYDLVVVGGGPAGMSAALEAATHGLEVLLVEEFPILGGSLAYARFGAEATRAQREHSRLVAEIESSPNIAVYTDAVCNGLFADNFLPVIRGSRMCKVRAKQVVVATGAFEQPIVFRNNDLPGIMLGSGAQRLMRLYGVPPGRRAVVASANEHGYEVALDLLDAGVEVAAIVELRHETPRSPAADAAQDRGIVVHGGTTIAEALGNGHVTGVRIAPITGQGAYERNRRIIECDCVMTSVGYAPAGNLVCYAGGRFAYDEDTAMHRVFELPQGVVPAGSVNGVWDLDSVLADGRRTGWRAARVLGRTKGEPPPAPPDALSSQITHPWPIFPHPQGKDFVDFDEDLEVKDIRHAVLDGYDDVQLLKRYSTLGMGPSQGRHSSIAAIRLLAEATGRGIDEVGTTTARPPYIAEKFAHLAGRGFDPVRHTVMHHRHLELGARMMVAGAWLRPAHYGAKEDAEALIAAEVRNCRDNVGLIDVSTLGGFDIRGPGAAEFVQRMYTWNYLRQEVGRARYALMCDEAGVIVDDGVACRLHERHFYVTATTGGADAVYRQMLWWNAQWRLDVDITNVTAAYCGINVAGPLSRELLARICDDVDLSPEAFPYMGVRTGHVAGIPARLLRVGFVGELGYEIHVPASLGEALWDALTVAGAPFRIRPFGVEAQRVMRLEKGHIIIGQDTDGLTHPYEAAMGWAIGKSKPFFVGKRSIEIQQARGVQRTLVGFTLSDADAKCPKECHLVIRDGAITGRVTSAVRSPTHGKVIGLAYVVPDQAEIGQRFQIRIEDGEMVEARVVPVPFYDPDNRRQEL
jgi:sarcosine oxidase, subunit alpha